MSGANEFLVTAKKIVDTGGKTPSVIPVGQGATLHFSVSTVIFPHPFTVEKPVRFLRPPPHDAVHFVHLDQVSQHSSCGAVFVGVVSAFVYIFGAKVVGICSRMVVSGTLVDGVVVSSIVVAVSGTVVVAGNCGTVVIVVISSSVVGATL